MLTRPYILAIIVVFATAACFAAQQADRDGSTKAKAIPLKERGMKAVEEEMAWMLKLYNYSPILAVHDAVANVSSKAKGGKKSVNTPAPWGHRTLDHNGHLISYWWFMTPRGKKEIYFDTGISSDTLGEVAEQESARAQYMRRIASSVKLQ
jgi:hypothetical protein